MESPLLENDLSQPSVLEPSDLFVKTDAPSVAVLCFFPKVVEDAAAVSAREEATVMGCRDFVIVGGAGALVPELPLGHAVLVDRALRSAGSSRARHQVGLVNSTR